MITMGTLFRLGLIATLCMLVQSKMTIIDTPEELKSCFDQPRFHTREMDPRLDNVHQYCIQKFRWHLQALNPNITTETTHWIDELLRMANKEARTKRQSLRRRVEIRRATDQQRQDYFRAINMLKRDTDVKPNRFDALGLLHQQRGDDVHHGAAFLAFHRVLLLIFENALRQKVPGVTLLYFDSRLDQPLRDPTRSIIWSPQFVGTMKGRVIDGPFRYWQTPAGPLVRAGGHEGEYFTYRHIRAVMTRSTLEEISEPHAPPPFDFEIRHGDVHQHIGGIMSPAETAAYDPIFYLHHCFVDYLWEVFRRSQREKGVDPTRDYPRRYGTAAHAPNSLMGLGRLRNLHGMSDMYTTRMYTYEPSPTCSYRNPSCGSRYLTCEFQFGRPQCVTLEMITPTTPTAPFGSATNQQTQQRTTQTSRFPNFPVGNRIPQFPPRFGRRKRQAGVIDASRMSTMGQNVLSQFGQNGLARFAQNRTEQQKEHQQKVQMGFSEKYENNVDVFQRLKEGDKEIILSPMTNMCPPTVPTNVIQNLFQMNGISDSRIWVYIPVQVIYKRQHEQMVFDSFPIEEGQMKTGKDIYDPTGYDSLKGKFIQNVNYSRSCRDMDGIFTKIMVHSDGLNYHGSFREFAVVDSRQPYTSSTIYVAVKSPEKFHTEAIFQAYDPCGNICKPYCKRFGHFQPCDGSLKLDNTPPKLYGKDYGEAIQLVWSITNEGIPIFRPDNIQLQFVCN
ncbi:uncharacterized protein LOC133205781 [Saccostrea echinata]|uniref:uncharacterized protein LOC133205781 n=1 Tax=Saccostrea echinata TaxID=191078 RepID=UPI002A80BF00|nr:uncharacterized protein LOC133205781 [Saccostrea echinata]XP_061197636.1 uncharacterized protein LOC133205781 [Saccostrea echinata]